MTTSDEIKFYINGMFKDEVHNSNHKIVVIDSTNPLTNRPWSIEDVAYMKNHEKPKKLLALVVADEIIPRAWYWKPEWKTKRPNWMEAGKIIIENLIKTEFDGVYIENSKYDGEINTLIKLHPKYSFEIYRKSIVTKKENKPEEIKSEEFKIPPKVPIKARGYPKLTD